MLERTNIIYIFEKRGGSRMLNVMFLCGSKHQSIENGELRFAFILSHQSRSLASYHHIISYTILSHQSRSLASCQAKDWSVIGWVSANGKTGLLDRRSATSQHGRPQTRRPSPTTLIPCHPGCMLVIRLYKKGQNLESHQTLGQAKLKRITIGDRGLWLPGLGTGRPEWLSSDLLSDLVETLGITHWFDNYRVGRVVEIYVEASMLSDQLGFPKCSR